MVCRVCNNKTTWETSVGDMNFIVCNKCVDKISTLFNIEPIVTTGIILKIGKNIKKTIDK